MSTATQTTAELLAKLEVGLFELSHLIKKHQEVVNKKFKVSAVELEILKLLKRDGAKKMKDVGNTVQVKLSNLTNIIDRLEQHRFVKRVNSKTDRRSIFVHITSKGEKMLSDYGDFLRELSSRMKDEVGESGFATFVENFDKIIKVSVGEEE